MKKISTFAKTINDIHFSKFLLIIGVILVLPLLYRYIFSQVSKAKQQATETEKLQKFIKNQNPVTRQEKLNLITTNSKIHTSVMIIVKGLGINYHDNPTSWFSWANPRGWSENDDEVADEVIKQRLNYKLLVKCYYEITNSRDLSSDLLDLLDYDSMKRVQKYINLI